MVSTGVLLGDVLQRGNVAVITGTRVHVEIHLLLEQSKLACV